MKYVQQVFERMSRGGFIPADSVDEGVRRIYVDLDDNREEYAEYFSKIGFILEEGKRYFHFSRKESKTALIDKLKKMGHWIDVLDFLKAWEPAFGPGFTFLTADLIVKIDSDIELRDKAKMLYDNRTRHDEIATRLVEELTKQGFIELLDNVTQRHSVTSAYRYLEDLVELIDFEEDEISE